MTIEERESNQGAVYAEFYRQEGGIVRKWLGKIFKGYSPTPDFTPEERAEIRDKAQDMTKQHGDVYVVVGGNEKE